MAGEYEYIVADNSNESELYFTDTDMSISKIAKRNHVCTVDVMFIAIKTFVDLEEAMQDKVIEGWCGCSQE